MAHVGSEQILQGPVLGHAGNSFSLAKRRKTKLACNECRQVKTRCDGNMPACSRCEKKGLTSRCQYEQSTLRTQSYISFLEKRVRELERSGHHPESRSVDSPPLHDRLLSTEWECSVGEVSNQKTDALTMVPSPEESNGCHCCGSSAPAFMQSMARAVGISENTECLDSAFKSDSVQGTGLKGIAKGQTADVFDLPSRERADHLIHQYWAFVHPIFPILHKPSFMSLYENFWTPRIDAREESFPANNAVLRAIVNIVFAHGCQQTADGSLADMFYQRSRGLFQTDSLDSPSIEDVQLLLLTGIYLQSTRYANRCWNVVGLAIRCAQTLGLHLEHSVQKQKSQIEQEMRRRIWHSCVIIDRLLSLTFNRPGMIYGNSNVPLPLEIDDEYLWTNLEKSQPRESPSLMGFFVLSVRLFNIMNHTLSQLYQHDSESCATNESQTHQWARERLHTVLSLSSSLDDLSLTLPCHLKPGFLKEPMEKVLYGQLKWQGYVFHSRLLYIRILLLRPLFLYNASRRTRSDRESIAREETLEERSITKCGSLCITATHELINHMHTNLILLPNKAGWREVHYACICAIVLLCARLYKSNDLAFEPSKIEESWHRCLAVIHHFRAQAESADRVANVLKAMETRVNEMSDKGACMGFLRSRDLVDKHQLAVGDAAFSSRMDGNEPLNLDGIFDFSSSERFNDEFPFEHNFEFGILDDHWSNFQTDMNFNE